ncbi:MAG: Ger(x)C family spore germination protein [Bacilli bacterium]
MKKLIVIIIILTTLTGCWNYRELNQLAIATGIAIDKDKDGYLVTIMIANSKKNGDNKQQAATTVYEGNGKTFFEAIKDVSLSVSRQIYLGHIEIIVLSEEIAKQDIVNATEFLFRYPQTRNEFYLILAQDCKAGDVLKITIPLESFPSQNVAKNLEITDKLQGFTYKVTFNDFIKTILEQGIHPVLPSINIVGDIKEGNSDENIKQNMPKTKLKLGMMGIFKNDKFITFATKDESKGINIINNKIKTSGFIIDCNGGNVVVEVTQLKTNIDFDLTSNIPKIKININAQAAIEEVSCKLDLKDKQVIQDIKTKSEQEAIKIVNSALTLAQTNQTDIFGFGNKIYKKNYKYWYKVKTNWDNEIFPKINFTTNAKIDLETKGSTDYRIEVTNGNH